MRHSAPFVKISFFVITALFVLGGFFSAEAQLSDEDRKKLQLQLIEIEEEILATQKELTQTKQETQSFERDKSNS